MSADRRSQHYQPGSYAGTGQAYSYTRQSQGQQQGAVGYRPLHAAPGGPGSSGGKGPRRSTGPSGTTVAAALLIVIGVALVAVALVMWLPHQRDYSAVHNVSAQAAQNVVEGTETVAPTVDFTALKQLNPEIVGWVQIPDTPVNYAVPQHSDNDFYLEHALDASYNPYGSVFLDYRSDPYAADYNTVIYGHHLKNGEEFAKIADYSDQAEFDTLSVIYYVSQDGVVHRLTPLCVFVVDGYDVDSVRTSFTDQQDFTNYLGQTLARSSARNSQVAVSGIDHLYMLSTCSYERENDRTILVCVDADVYGGEAGVSDAADIAAIEQGVSDVTGVADPNAEVLDETGGEVAPAAA